MPRNEKRLDAFTTAYVEAALWSTNDESDDQGGDPLDKNYSIDDIAPETMTEMEEDCAAFQQQNAELLEQAYDQRITEDPRRRGGPGPGDYDAERAGHDFWLTRNGHGVGYWDRDLGDVGDKLADAAHAWGNYDLYVGDDGMIYGSGPTRHRRATEAPSRHTRTVVRDFNTLPELIDHARQEGATHVVVNTSGNMAWLFFPVDGGKYAEARVRQAHGFWHADGPSNREVIDRRPRGAVKIEDWLAKTGGTARESHHSVRDYIAVDHRGRPLSGPTKDYSAAKREADQAGGFVKFTTNPPGKLSEAWGRNTLSDWQILDAIGKGQQVPPEAEARAVKLAQLGFIDTRGAWRLTPKGRQAIEQRVPVAAEAPRRRTPAARRGVIPGTADSVMKLAAKLSQQTDGGMPKYIEGGFRWSEKNEAAQFTTVSPEYGQKVVVVVGVFEDGSTAITFFSDEGLSGIDTYENISNFTYAGADTKSMVQDINWVRQTVDGYAASWQQDQPEVDESRRSRPRRSTRRAPPPKRRRSTHR